MNRFGKDADKKLEHNPVSKAIRIGGRWGGAALGAKVGAVAGGLTGPLAAIAVPVLDLAGGVGGAFGGDAFAKWSVDITCTGCETDVLEETKRASFAVRRN